MNSAKEPKPIANAPVKVVLVDDHVSLREMLKFILNREGYEVVGEVTSGLDALRVCRSLRPQIVVVDLTLPVLNGTHLIRLLLREEWGARVVVYTGTMDGGLMSEALAESPHGFVSKEDSLPELREALRAVTRGVRHVSPHASRVKPAKPNPGLDMLTPQERAVLQMVAEGLHTKQIADALCITPKTAEHYRQKLREKLGLHDVTALTRYAIRHGMMPA